MIHHATYLKYSHCTTFTSNTFARLFVQAQRRIVFYISKLALKLVLEQSPDYSMAIPVELSRLLHHRPWYSVHSYSARPRYHAPTQAICGYWPSLLRTNADYELE